MSPGLPVLYIVDDDPILARTLRRFLRDSYEVLASEAEEALAYTIEPSLILCDLEMPRMDGLAFYQELLARKPSWAARLVFMTGAPEDDRVQATGRPVLPKPIDGASLHAALEALLKALGPPSGA